MRTAICDEHEIAVINTCIRIYALREELNAATAFTTAQSKEVTTVYEEKEIKSRNKHLLGETRTDENGEIWVAGAAQFGNQTVPTIAKYSSNGVLDNSFGDDGYVAHPFGNTYDFLVR